MFIEKVLNSDSHTLKDVRKAFFEEKGLELITEYMKENLSDNPEFSDFIESYQKDYEEKRKIRENAAIKFITDRTGIENITCYSIDFNESKVTYKYETEKS